MIRQPFVDLRIRNPEAARQVSLFQPGPVLQLAESLDHKGPNHSLRRFRGERLSLAIELLIPQRLRLR